MRRVVQHLRRAALADNAEALSDDHLLECFIARQDEAAFEALVRRYGQLVFGVCKRILRHHEDAEDAFQATFLILARKAKSLRARDLLGNWLYGVAYRTSLRTRAMTARRRKKEQRAARSSACMEPPQDDAAALLDEELNRLAERYRLPVILCDLQGTSRKAVADDLGIPLGTLSSRLAFARKRLALRLSRRGVTLGVVAAVSVPPGLAHSTAQAAMSFAAGKAAGLLSAQALCIAEGVLKAMYVLKLGKALTIAVGILVLLSTSRQLVLPSSAEEPPAPRSSAPPAPATVAQAGPRVTEVIDQALQAANDIEDGQWKAWMLEIIGKVQAKAGQKEEALRTLRKAIEVAKTLPVPRNHHTLHGIAGAQAEAGAAKEAKETAEAIEQEDSRDYGISNISVAQANAGDFKGALESSQAVGADRLKGQALWHLAEEQAKAGQFKEALETAESIANTPSRALAFAFIARAQYRKGERAGALKSLQEALKIAEPLQDPEGGNVGSPTLGQIAAVQARLGDVQEARKLAHSIQPEVWKSSALTLVAEAQADAGDFEGALGTAGGIQSSYQQGDAFTRIVTRQLQAGKKDDAQMTADAIVHPSWRVSALRELGKDHARRGDHEAATKAFQRAQELANDIQDDEHAGNQRNAALASLAQARAEAGQAREALAWAAQQTEPLLRCQAFLCVAQGLAARAAAKQR